MNIILLEVFMCWVYEKLYFQLSLESVVCYISSSLQEATQKLEKLPERVAGRPCDYTKGSFVWSWNVYPLVFPLTLYVKLRNGRIFRMFYMEKLKQIYVLEVTSQWQQRGLQPQFGELKSLFRRFLRTCCLLIETDLHRTYFLLICISS